MLAKKFQIYSVKITDKYIYLWVKRLNLFIFTHAPKQGFYHYTPGIKNSVFENILSSTERVGRGLSSWKDYQN